MNFQFNNLDLRNILDLIPQPGIILDASSSKIVTCNYLFLEFSGYQIHEIVNANYGAIFPDLELGKVNDSDEKSLSIRVKYGEEIIRRFSIKFVNSIHHLLFICVADSSLSEPKFSLAVNFFLELLEKIFVLQELCMDNIYKEFLKSWLENGLSDDAVFFIRRSAESNSMHRISTGNSSFPEDLPIVELDRVGEIDIWEPKKRVLSEIHRAGRQFKFLQIISIILNDGKQNYGLFVNGNYSDVGGMNLVENSELWRKMINAFILHFDHFFGLKQKYLSQTTDLEKYLFAFENSIEGILLLDGNDRIIEVNPKFLKIINYSPSEVLNKQARQIFGNTDFMSLILFFKNSGRKFLEEESIILDHFGKTKNVHIRMTHLSIENDNKYIYFVEDRSEIEKIKESNLKLGKLAEIGETLSGFSHDARNIINRQTTGIQLLAKKHDLSAEEDPQVSSLLEDCVELTEMMESILSLSRQNLENLELIDLQAFFQKLIFRSKYKAERYGIELQIINRSNSAYVKGDQRSLERAFQNIINNGIEANKDTGGLVAINIEEDSEDESNLLIKIADTGPGIPFDISKDLFVKQKTDKPDGTGIGLLISDKIIKSHNGKIDIESFPGGTIFTICLPGVQNTSGELS